MENKKALITGITGQDGFYLSKFLLEKNYEVHGIIRRNALGKIGHLTDKQIKLYISDLTDTNGVNSVLRKINPQEIYHLGAQTFVKLSFDQPEHTIDVNIKGTLNILSGMRMWCPSAKLYNAGSSEMFGNVRSITNINNKSWAGLNEQAEFYPTSPYAVSKVAAYQLCQIYRKAYDLFICNGILFNHESPKRGPEFVTRKIILGMVKYFKALESGTEPQQLVLGNIDAKRDWGFSGDYVEAMWMMLQHKIPDDYVIATGQCHSVKEFCEITLEILNNKFKLRELHVNNINDIIVISESHKRPLEVNTLKGDTKKAFNELGWKPVVYLRDLIKMMVDAEL